MNKKTILFSGRFDKPHLSHFLTIRDLSIKYKTVYVVMLDYKGSHYPACMREHILEKMFEDYGNVCIVVNQAHFGKITKEELDEFAFDVYGSGNEDVLKHMESLGVDCVFVPRTLDTAASDDVKYQKVKKALEE